MIAKTHLPKTTLNYERQTRCRSGNEQTYCEKADEIIESNDHLKYERCNKITVGRRNASIVWTRARCLTVTPIVCCCVWSMGQAINIDLTLHRSIFNNWL